jgi:hypothetical protein
MYDGEEERFCDLVKEFRDEAEGAESRQSRSIGLGRVVGRYGSFEGSFDELVWEEREGGEWSVGRRIDGRGRRN